MPTRNKRNDYEGKCQWNYHIRTLTLHIKMTKNTKLIDDATYADAEPAPQTYLSLFASKDACIGQEGCGTFTVSPTAIHQGNAKSNFQYDHTTICFKEGRNRDENFEYATTIPFDIDNSHSDSPEDWITPDDVKADLEQRDISFWMYPSRNHQLEKNGETARPRFHVLLPLSKPLHDSDKYVRFCEWCIKTFNANPTVNKKSQHLFGYGKNPNPFVECYREGRYVDDVLSDDDLDIAITSNAETTAPVCSTEPDAEDTQSERRLSQVIALDKIGLTYPHRFRVQENAETIAEYAEVFRQYLEDKRNGQPVRYPFEPIHVLLEDGQHHVVAGCHRYLGAKDAGMKTMHCIVITDPDEAFLIGLRSNNKHGLRPNAADKAHCIEVVLKQYPNKSNREVAKMVECNSRYVDRIVKEKELRTSTHVEGKDGKMHPVKKAPVKKQDNIAADAEIELQQDSGVESLPVDVEIEQAASSTMKQEVESKKAAPTEKAGSKQSNVDEVEETMQSDDEMSDDATTEEYLFEALDNFLDDDGVSDKERVPVCMRLVRTILGGCFYDNAYRKEFLRELCDELEMHGMIPPLA